MQMRSVSPTGPKCLYALTIVDRFTQFALLVASLKKEEQTSANTLVERVLSIFESPETLPSSQGAPYRPKETACWSIRP